MNKLHKWIRCCLVGSILCGMMGACGCSSSAVSLTVCDSAGNAMAQIERYPIAADDLEDSGQWAYIDIVLDEAAAHLQKKYDCSAQEAQRRLLESGYTVHTVFDTACYEAMRAAYEGCDDASLTFGSALTDLHGKVLAVYSGGEESVNYSKQALSPYSAFKPLSVYAPAIEAGVINWSSMYTDSPYKQIVGADGKPTDWPVNATGTYTMQGADIPTAIKQSLNTVAVKCLDSLGADQSLRFLREKLGLSLEFEQNKLVLEGQEEVIGNIAMGYLQQGVSPIDMAGYYQMFANGGVYCAPYTVSTICTAEGETVYEATVSEQQAISASTAYIMNRLLQTVVQTGGTGESAGVPHIPIGGKTGTGSADDGNWFVGFTPQYSCAVWHGKSDQPNRSAAIFADILSAAPNDSGKKAFPTCGEIQQVAYCGDSGLKLSADCRTMRMGYYHIDDVPSPCDAHKNNH